MKDKNIKKQNSDFSRVAFDNGGDIIKYTQENEAAKIKDKPFEYEVYEIVLYKQDEDGNMELHPNGKPKLYTYSSYGLVDVCAIEMEMLNDNDYDLQENVIPIPMGKDKESEVS